MKKVITNILETKVSRDWNLIKQIKYHVRKIILRKTFPKNRRKTITFIRKRKKLYAK